MVTDWKQQQGYNDDIKSGVYKRQSYLIKFALGYDFDILAKVETCKMLCKHVQFCSILLSLCLTKNIKIKMLVTEWYSKWKTS